MKATLLSSQSKRLVNVLNGKATILITKYPLHGWVYLYCTKGKPYLIGDKLLCDVKTHKIEFVLAFKSFLLKDLQCMGVDILNGKVVARFYVEEGDNKENGVLPIKKHFGYFDVGNWTESWLLEKSCLTRKQLCDHFTFDIVEDSDQPSPIFGYANCISKLEIFDRPREIGEFFHYSTWKGFHREEDVDVISHVENNILIREVYSNYLPRLNGFGPVAKAFISALKKAPAVYQYIEVEGE